ncbi:MAG: hypothetical protein V4692_10875 [Bdellovibrionota bacterium]
MSSSQNGGSNRGSNNGTSRKTKRKLTPFLAKEMLYDYSIGALDEERHAAVEQILKDDKECQVILASIQSALEYVAQLSNTDVPETSIHAINDADNFASIGRKYSSWSAWPDSFRWSVTALAFSICAAAAVIFVPWSKIPLPRSQKSNQIEVAQLDKPKVSEGVETVGSPNEQDGSGHEEEAGASGDSSGDEYGEEAGESVPDGEVYTGAPAKLLPATNNIADVASQATKDPAFSNQVVPPNSPQKPSAKIPAKPVVAAKPVAVATPASTPAPTAAPAKQAKVPTGYVFRAFMTLENLDDLAPEITDQIFALGGEKAGEVDIGWKRGNGRYYHFALPEENEQKLLEQLQVYGPVRISKDPHPRVMPTGQVRFILWIESAN